MARISQILKCMINRVVPTVKYNNTVNIQSSLSEISAAIDYLLKDADPKFLKLCEDSQTLYNSIELLKTDINESAKQIDINSDDSPFNIVETLAFETLDNFGNATEIIRESVENISILKDKINNLADHTEKFQESSGYLRIIRTNISMESVRTNRSREMFAALSDEIQALSNRINEISTSMTNDLTEAYRNQKTAEGVIHSGLEHIKNLHQKASHQIENATSDAKQMVEYSSKWLEKVSAIFQTVSQDISQVVISMQFHDIFRQQLEHTIEAIDQTCDKLRENTTPNTLGFTYKVIQMQQAQIDHVYSEVETAYHNIKNSFNHISNQIQKLDTESSNETDSDNNAFAKLVVELNQFNNHIKQASSLSDHTRETIDTVRQTTISLAGYIKEIRKISRELSFKALNAIVLTERLGQDGKTLAVLTEEVYAYAGNAQKLGDKVTSILGEMSSISKRLTDKSSDENMHLEMQDLANAINMMENNYRNYNNSAGQAKSKIENITRTNQFMVSSLNFIELILQNLKTQKQHLTSCSETLEKYKNNHDRSLDNELEKLHDSYTMEQERKIHMQSLGHKSEPAAKQEPSGSTQELQTVAAGCGAEELDDNIELF